MSRIAAIITTLGILLAGGLLHGLSSERWRSSAILEAAAARVQQVPMEIGDWVGRSEKSEGDDEAFDMAGARGSSWSRIYVHQKTKQAVKVILMCGRPGRMSVHTPQMCYRGAGYEMPEDAVRQTFESAGDKAATFWTALFTKPAGLTSDLRLYWAWNSSVAWEASDNPRWRFRGEPFLYKLYVAHDLVGQNDAGPANDLAAVFLRLFLPELAQALFPSDRQLT